MQTKSDGIGTTIMVPATSSVSSISGVATYKSISIIASNTETAALGLVSIGNCNFETGSTSLEPQSIIVENIDLEALNPAFVTSSGNQILNWFAIIAYTLIYFICILNLKMNIYVFYDTFIHFYFSIQNQWMSCHF